MQHEEFLKQYLPTKRQGAFINVGAHEGDWIADSLELFGSIIAIEANPICADTIRRRFPEPPVGNVTVLDAAAWIVSGQMMAFNVRSEQPMSGALACRDILRGEGVTQTIQVPTIAIDDIHKTTCDLLIVDVEGAELQVIQGATRTIEQYKPQLIIECHEREHRDWLQTWLTRAGYNLAIVHNPARSLTDPDWDRNTHLIGYHWQYRGAW